MKRSLLFMLALAAGGLAQDAGALRITLKDAVNLALKQNPNVILANLDVARSEQERQAVRAGLLPQVSATSQVATHRVNLEASMGLSIPGIPQHVGPFGNYQGGVQFQAPIFDLTLWRRYRSSQYAVEGVKAQEVSAREQSVLLVVSQYLGAQRAAADVQAAESRVALAQALYTQAADLQQHGVGTGIDTLRANVQLQNEKQRLIVAQTQFDTARFGLARLLNVDPKRDIELADQVSFAETPAVDANDSITHALASRPEMRQLSAQRSRAELAVKGASEARLPRVTATGGWMEQARMGSNAIPAYEYRADLQVPLFTGGRIQAERAQAEIAVKQISQQEQELRNRIALEVKTAVARLDAARNEVAVANQGVELSRQEVEQARDRFEAGVASNIEVTTAQDALARANDNQIAALYRFNQARADLAHATGQMEALYAR